MNKPKFAIGIPTINRYDLLKESLLKYLNNDFVDIEIFVVDNGHQKIDIVHKNLFVFESEKNLGVSASWNLLLEAIFTDHDYAFIINDDIYLGSNTAQIENLLSSTKEDFYVAQVNWCAFIMPKTTFESVGYFDTNFFPAYYEDNDMHYRMKLKGMSYYPTQIITPVVFRNSMTIEKDPSLNKGFDDLKTYYIKKWGGIPTEEKYTTPFNISETRHLNIITPTVRIGNLDKIRESIIKCLEYENINVNWWIILDKTVTPSYNKIKKEFESLSEKLNILVILSDKEKAIAGHAHRNIILNLLRGYIHKDQWVYFLDDDNILHNNFLNFFATSDVLNTSQGVIFSQVDRHNNLRLEPKKDNIKVCHVDTAMYLFKLGILGDLKFVETDYCADGIFIEELYKQHSSKFSITTEVLCYYNFLSQNTPMNLFPSNTLSFCPVPILQNEWEFERLLALYIELQPKNIMEIGSFYGGTLWFWLTHSVGFNKVITLDYPVPPSDGRYEEMMKCRSQWDSWTKQVGVKEFHNVIGDSTSQESKNKVNSIIKEGELDFLFIDGGHTYDVVKSDYETYSKYVRKGGIIAFHDVIGLEEVRQYWNELKQGKPYVEISHNTSVGWGIGVLFVE